MFAEEDPNYLSRDKKWVCEIFSIVSFIFSFFVIIVALNKIKRTITNVLIIQIIMSELLDGINIALAIVIDSFGKFTFENYPKRMGFCITQIFLGVFSCLWNLFSSLFISIRIFDRMQNKNKIFKNKFMYEYTTTMSYGIPCIITYILWTIQVLYQSNTLKNKKYKDYYKSENNTNFFRYMYCWVTGGSNYALFAISFLLIGANFYFSIFKSALFIRKISREIEDVDDIKEDDRTKENKVSKIKSVMKNLIIYPIVSGCVWIIYFILQILSGQIYRSDNTDFINSMKRGVGAWLIIIIICVRQIIFTLMFFLTQGNLKRHTYNILCCKKGKTARKTSINSNSNTDNVEDTEKTNILNDSVEQND